MVKLATMAMQTVVLTVINAHVISVAVRYPITRLVQPTTTVKVVGATLKLPSVVVAPVNEKLSTMKVRNQ